jgi:hypothetical protein
MSGARTIDISEIEAQRPALVGHCSFRCSICQ